MSTTNGDESAADSGHVQNSTGTLEPAAMKLGRENVGRTLLERIARYELITEEKFMKRLGVSSEWIAGALAASQLFSFRGAENVQYFPAFYFDATFTCVG